MKSFGRYILSTILALSVFAGCDKEPEEQVLLEIDRTNMKMTVGQSQKLNAVLKGVEGDCVWESDCPEVADVNADGVVSALSAGKANVVVTAQGLSKSCTVEVIDFTAAKLELNSEFTKDDVNNYTYLIHKGDELKLDPKFYNAEGEKVNEMAYPKYAIITSNPSKLDETVISVNDEGLVQALNPGYATVKISGAGQAAFVRLTVKSIELNESEMTMFVNQSNALVATIYPEDLPESQKLIEWNSYSAGHVQVNNKGVVRALKATDEPVVVTAQCGELTAECAIQIADYTIDAVVLSALDGLKMSDGTYQMYVGANPYDLCVKFQKDGQDVTQIVEELAVKIGYTSSNPNVATIENGIISVKAAGSTDINVNCAGKTASFKLDVIQCVESVKIISPDAYPYVIGNDIKTFTIQYAVYPENASIKTVTFSSSDADVATVDPKTGVVTVHKSGDAQITLTTDGMMKPYLNQNGETVAEPATVNLWLVVNDGATEVSVEIKGEGVQDGTLSIEKGREVQLTADVKPYGYNGTVVWSTSTPNILSIDSTTGLLKALARGEGKVAVVVGGAVADLSVNVLGIEPTAIKIDQAEDEEYKKDIIVTKKSILLTASITAPENGDYAGVNWYSSNTDVATVDSDGKVIIKKAGTVTITAKAKSLDASSELDVTASITLNFVAPPVEKVIVTLPKSRIEVGETVQLGYIIVPEEAESKNVSWKINESAGFATITNDGLITGVKSEKDADGRNWKKEIVEVTVDGVKATAEVEIIPKQPKDILVELPKDGKMKIRDSWYFRPRIVPSDLSGFSVGVYGTVPNQTQVAMPNGAKEAFVPEVPGLYSLGFYTEQTDNLVYTIQKQVNINVLPYWVESVSLPATSEMEIGTLITMNPTFTSDVEGVLPTYRDVKWTSSNPSVATVNENSGEITALSVGKTNITATTTNGWAVPSGHEQKSATCELTVMAPDVPLNVGDYFYSDGTWSTELQSGKTVIGVVFAKANATTSDPMLAKDYPGCKRGLVLGLTEYASQDFGSVSYSSGHGYYESLGFDPAAIVSQQKVNGYGNTKAHKTLNASKADYVSLFNAQTGVVAVHTKSVATPSNATTWYVPSYREMELIHANYDTINASLKAAGGVEIAAPYQREESFDNNRSSDWYWTSTIYGKVNNSTFQHYKYPFDISKGTWTTSQQNSALCKVRVVFAF